MCMGVARGLSWVATTRTQVVNDGVLHDSELGGPDILGGCLARCGGGASDTRSTQSREADTARASTPEISGCRRTFEIG
jgi:hypothetical protein